MKAKNYLNLLLKLCGRSLQPMEIGAGEWTLDKAVSLRGELELYEVRLQHIANWTLGIRY